MGSFLFGTEPILAFIYIYINFGGSWGEARAIPVPPKSVSRSLWVEGDWHRANTGVLNLNAWPKTHIMAVGLHN
jgi:hypothetical protein